MTWYGFCLIGSLLSAIGCSHKNTCVYKGKTYNEGETWHDECRACECPAAGSKAVWCVPPVCGDGGADADGNGSNGAAEVVAPPSILERGGAPDW